MDTPHPPTTLVDWLDDLTVRFILNLPPSELSSVPRLCFQVEEAQWYYEDFIRPAVAASGSPPLPSLSLRQFCLLLFQHCPLFSGYTDTEHLAAYEEFLAYKVRVPVRGAILLDQDMEKVLLVRGWKKGASWSFPRGKINKDEKDLDCAIREVYEETGYDIRQAGLVPENEEHAKYIDITMREQHMRLFVLRGVPEDTFFEPKTRKEIGKISWYAIKDLPGFKKQKTHHEGEATHANKFYMVAPFLGQLKKWITLQKKNDRTKAEKAAEISGEHLQTATEDEADVEAEIEEQPVPDIADKSEDLKRLLSIGQPEAQLPPVADPTIPTAYANHLLAMLQGVGQPERTQAVQTPLERVTPFPQQSITPQPDHMRPIAASHAMRSPPPNFPLPPQRVAHEQHRHGSLPNPNIFGPAPNGHTHRQPSGQYGAMPHYPRQEQLYQQTQNMHVPQPPHVAWGQNRVPFSHTPSMAPTGSHHQQLPPHAYQAQGPQGAIASGPAVPHASQLPPPRLNAASMKLLDAFKIGTNQAAPPISPSKARTQRPASTHQTALLDLFRKPSVPAAPIAEQSAAPLAQQRENSASPTLTDVTVKPAKPAKRKSTHNEITRTLPIIRPKIKAPPVVEAPAQRPVSPVVPQYERGSPKSTKLFDPMAPKVQATLSDKALLPQQSRPDFSQPPRIPSASKSPRARHGSPAQSGVKRSSAHVAPTVGKSPTPAFKILARPGSAKGGQPPAAPLDTNRDENQTAAFQPQVLKRPQSSAANNAEPKPADKKDQLLALFGKTASSTVNSPSLPAAQQKPPTRSDPIVAESSNPRNPLLDLFTPPTANSQKQPTPTTTPTPTPTPSHIPPPAPRIEPERRPSSKFNPIRQPYGPPSHPVAQNNFQPRPQQQNLLLDLLTRNSKPTGTPTITSPGTPISPFTLGTPAAASPPPGLGRVDTRKDAPVGGSFGRSSRLGSVASPTSSSGGGSTPVEAKQFLKGFLDDVVRSSEGVGGRR